MSLAVVLCAVVAPFAFPEREPVAFKSYFLTGLWQMNEPGGITEFLSYLIGSDMTALWVTKNKTKNT